MYIKKFEAFLKKERALEKFKKNLGAKMLYEHGYEKFIADGFTWAYTKEGTNFWHKLNLKWIEEVCSGATLRQYSW